MKFYQKIDNFFYEKFDINCQKSLKIILFTIIETFSIFLNILFCFIITNAKVPITITQSKYNKLKF